MNECPVLLFFVGMETHIGFGVHIDKTLKKIAEVYLAQFKEHGIDVTLEQWVILQQIQGLGEAASQAEISKLNFRNRATVSRVIRGLTRKGLIIKSRFEGDKKRFRLEITDKGNDLIIKAMPVILKLRGIGGQGINSSDLEIFVKVLDQLWINYDTFESKQNQ